ncbi:uncharacterized protein LOC113272799 [Papaver somniferum]|uniref:uncharacterized protein LOC113272799 n=1 Tax=Papaver somniferum TaxID=3469 RepID=UPI000E6F8116|nr:uncharacterized protein LOC113272799 [Papaver somniferum]
MGENHDWVPTNTDITTVSYAEMVKGKQTLIFSERILGRKQHVNTKVDLCSLPNPSTNEGKPAVEIPQEYFMEGCDIWSFSLIGRIDFKGTNFNTVKNSLEQQWDLGQGGVQFVPLNLDKQSTSRATVWVRFPGLPMELWVEKTLLAIGKSLGNPVMVDERTLNHEYGHFASVLIEIDFAKHNTDAVHVKVGDRDFWKAIEIPKQPKFCSTCGIIGHLDGNCRKKKRLKKQPRLPPKPQWKAGKEDVVNLASNHKNDWKEVRHKKNGVNGSIGSQSQTEIIIPPTPLDDFTPVLSTENLVKKVLTHQVVSTEESDPLELAQKLEDD